MKPVLICTEKKGVFMGMCEDAEADPLVLYDAQMCVSWSKETRGVMGLAAKGPANTPGTRIGPIVASISHAKREITCVVAVSDAAVGAWRAEPWNG